MVMPCSRSADQGRFAVIDAAAGEEAQQARPCCNIQAGRAPGQKHGGPQAPLHQKYPSRFLRSMESASSLSISRVPRSEVREAAISLTISGSDCAALSMAAVSG